MSDTEEQTIAENRVLTKYKMSGELVNRALKKLIESCIDEASVRNLCIEGEKLLTDELSKIFKKERDLSKGIAFPVCVSVNHCINHFSPLESEEDQILKDGDLVKLDFGVHIDGFIAVVAHSLIVGATKENKVTGRQADVMLAAHYAAEAALRLFKPGFENTAISTAVSKVSEVYSCSPVEGMLSFQLQQNRIDGEKLIRQTPNNAQRKDVERCTVEPHEVYAMDVILSTGKGQGKEMDSRVTIYKKTEEAYSLKLKCSREFFRKVSKEHGQMPFSLRCFEEEKKARMGVMECVTHKLVAPYPVLWEKQGEYVAQFKYTVLVMPNGPQRITGFPLDIELCQSEIKIEDNKEVMGLIKASMNVRKKKKNPTSEGAAEAPASETVSAEA
uniref:Proliferation-associated protein 2G4-like n=1 Tax=Hirondellea gigas TaxID=1518452 RepID=A0A2P2I1D9_9CRUS